MNEATSSSATPRTKATAKTTAKAAATKTTRTAAKSTAKTTTKTNHQAHFQAENRNEANRRRNSSTYHQPHQPEQFGRVNVLGITPSAENGLYPARVELGEAFKVTAQVFIEGRTKAGATVSVRNTRGTGRPASP